MEFWLFSKSLGKLATLGLLVCVWSSDREALSQPELGSAFPVIVPWAFSIYLWELSKGIRIHNFYFMDLFLRLRFSAELTDTGPIDLFWHEFMFL